MGFRLSLLRFATAYAITKALLPFRLIFSIWATPWFARIAIVPFSNVVKKLVKKKPRHEAGAAGTGATGGKKH